MEQYYDAFVIAVALMASALVQLVYRSLTHYLFAAETIVAIALLLLSFPTVNKSPIRQYFDQRITIKSLVVGLCVSIAIILVHTQYTSHTTSSVQQPERPLSEPLVSEPLAGEHPIEALIRTHKAHFDHTLEKQSRTLKEAVEEYKRRTGMHPPPKFDVWYEFVKANNVPIIDEYDTIQDLLRPFWGLSPASIRQSIRDALGAEDNGLLCVFIRNGNIVKTKFDWDRNPENGDFYSNDITKMIQKFVEHLPDMDLLFNSMDEPAVVIPHDILSHLVKGSQKRRPTTNPRNFFSARPSDIVDDIPSHYGTNFLDLAHVIAWERIVQSCPVDSPARQTNGADLTTSYAYGSLGFIYNTTAFSDVCNQPSLRHHHGFFDRASNLRISWAPLPAFSAAKPTTFNDILFPSVHYYMGRIPYDESQDMDWELKQNQMHWRGSTTTGFVTMEGIKKHHRQRFVAAMNNFTDPVNILKKVDKAWIHEVMSPDAAQALFDVKFDEVAEIATPEAFEAQKMAFDIAPLEDLQGLWKWKYVLDLDSMGYSGDYYPLLKSKSLVFKCTMFREWHDEWLTPWVHYIPLGLDGSDWFESVRFFAEEEIGHSLGKKIAYESRQWANRVLTREGMEAWVFRLLLEYVASLSSLMVDMLELSTTTARISDFNFNRIYSMGGMFCRTDDEFV